MKLKKALVASSLLTTPALADEAPYLGVGYVFSNVGGDAPTVGHGLEVTFGKTATPEGAAVLVQHDWNEDRSRRLAVGGQLSLAPLGIELAWSQRSQIGGGNTHGFHVAPFLSLGGIVHVAGRYVFPVKDAGHGTEYALVLGLKFPFVLGEMNLFRMPHGRPLRGPDGRPVDVPVWGVRDTSLTQRREGAQDAQPLGEAWLADARMEHASVAAFVRLARHLELLGAPRALQTAALRAADDERRHAAACFDLAGRYLGARLWASPIEVPLDDPPSWAELAVESLIEGCLGEGTAAQQAELALGRCGDAQVARTLAAISVEEAEHARLAAAVVAWAEGVGGNPVKSAVATARRRLPHELATDPIGGDASTWTHHGRLPPTLQAAAWAATRAQLAAG